MSEAVHTRPPLRRIVAVMAVALVVSGLAVWAGIWQFGRYETRADALAAFERAEAQPVAPLTEVVPTDATALPPEAVWRTVTASGQWDADSLTVLRGRRIDNTPTWQLLIWFDTDDGRSLLVNSGWIPVPGPLADPAWPTVPSGRTSITTVLREWDQDDGKEPAFSITRITPAQLRAPAQAPVPGYGTLRDYCADTDCPAWANAEVPLPHLSTGPHLSYAFQWWLFAVLAPIGGVLLLRRDRDELVSAAEGEPVTEPIAASAPKDRPARKRRELSDEEIEDAL